MKLLLETARSTHTPVNVTGQTAKWTHMVITKKGNVVHQNRERASAIVPWWTTSNRIKILPCLTAYNIGISGNVTNDADKFGRRRCRGEDLLDSGMAVIW